MKYRAVWQNLGDGTRRLRVLDEGANMYYHRYVNNTVDIVPVHDSVNVKVTRAKPKA